MRRTKERCRREWFAMPLVLGLLAGCYQAGLGYPGRMGQPSKRVLPEKPNGAANAPTKPSGVQITALTRANNQFGMRLFARVRQQDPRANVLVSPFSVAQTLQMILNGAAGSTRREMEQTLALSGITRDDMNRQNAQLSAMLNAPDPHVTFAVANSLWTKTPLRPDFVRRVQTTYGAKLGSLNSGSAAINSWVDAQTRHKIPTIVTPEDIADEDVVLVNAVYFKGTWANPFAKGITMNAPFTVGTGRKKSVPMMQQTGWYAYDKTDKFEAVTLPYKGDHYALTCVLPMPGTSLAAAAKALTPNALLQAGQAQIADIDLRLPRFTMRGDYGLNAVLVQMGMPAAFSDSEADLSDIGLRGDYIDRVLHKTFMAVDEQGTEAAAVTMGGGVPGAMSMPRPHPITFNRPFLIVLRDTRSGLILFIGVVNNP